MSKILEEVLKEFERIAAIPRPSKHEGTVADYLVDRLKALGAKVEKDETGNVIAEIAAPSSEGKPQFVLQAHMDMVCVSDGKKPYNPLTDSIKLVRKGKYLRAEGTSLGADDGIGIAIILYLLENRAKEGITLPLKVIFTVDEEVGMTGASNLDEKHLNGAKYLLNIDSENAEELVIGSAGSMRIEFKRQAKPTTPTKSEAVKLRIAGFKGGHSGEAIGIPHANAIKVLAKSLRLLDCEVARIKGGRAMNVIPSEAEAVIMLDHKELPKITDVTAEVYKTSRELDENDMSVSMENILNLPKQVFTAESTQALLKLIEMLEDGVHDSETSANIGVLKATSKGMMIEYMPRFHSETGYEVMKSSAIKAAEESGFKIDIGHITPPWKSENNDLADRMKAIAHEQGRELTKRVIHGGLECSYFSVKNPSLEIVSIGTTNLDIHSPKEKLLLSSVEPTVQLILETLRRGAVK